MSLCYKELLASGVDKDLYIFVIKGGKNKHNNTAYVVTAPN